MAKLRMNLNVGNSEQETYQWGNNDRGGCGAPLRDKGGVPIANLRKVMQDNSNSPAITDDRGRRHQNNGNNQHNNYDNDTEGINNGRGDRDRRDNGRRDREDDGDRQRNKSMSNFGTPRQDNARQNNGNGGSGCESPGSASSPKKFMGSLKQMSSGMGDKEREVKLRKEQEYQKQLRDQIEEKKRKKEEEKRGEDKTKQKEMQEYLRGHYKGEIPDHYKGAGQDTDNSDADGDRDRGQNPPPRGTRDRNSQSSKSSFDRDDNRGNNAQIQTDSRNRDNDMDRDRDGGGRFNRSSVRGSYESSGSPRERGDRDRRGGRDSPPMRRQSGRRDRDGDSYDDESTGDDQGANRDNRGHGRASSENSTRKNTALRREVNGNQYQDKNGRWVSEAEYGELTSLCDRLMSQQDRLQEEIHHQAELIKDLQRKAPPSTTGGKGAQGVGVGAALPLTRSKSVQQIRQSGGVKANGGKVDGQRRPLSTDARDRDRGRGEGSVGKEQQQQQQKKQASKVAFGGSALPAKSVFSKAGRDSVGQGQGPVVPGSKVPAAAKKVTVGLAFGGRAPSVVRGRPEPEAPVSRVRGAAVKGPVIVSYEGDDDGQLKGDRDRDRKGVDPKRYGASNNIRGSNSSTGASIGSKGKELSGQSEYLRMDGAMDDVMSGDQLDRLLVQAKRVRAAPH